VGVALRQPRLARGRRSPGLVWRTTESIAWRLAAGIALFVDVNRCGGVAKQRPDETEIGFGRTARGRCVCDFGCAYGDRLRWKHCAPPEQSRSRVCRTNQLRTLHLPHPGGDGFRSLAAVSNAVRDRDTLSACGRVRDRYPVHRRIVVAIAGTTDNPAAWRKKRDTEWNLGAGQRDGQI